LQLFASLYGLQLLNSLSKKQKNIEINNNISSSTNTIVSETNKQYEAITGQKKNENTYKTQTEVIKQFLDKCNEGDTQGAYDLLSDNCRQVEYPSINDFIDGYYNRNFDEKKSYNYQVWNGNTYKIEIRPDILSTGIYDSSVYLEDYYTLENNKLNINGYIARKKIEKELEKDNIKIKVMSMDFFRDYTVCNIQVFNKTDSEILLDTRDKENTVYLTDKKEVKYNSYINELNEEEIRVLLGEKKDIKIKFNCIYRENLSIKKLSFDNIIMNYENYTINNIEDKDAIKIEIAI